MQQVRVSGTSVYVNSTVILAYTAGYVVPAIGSPATNSWFPQPTHGPVAQSLTFRIPRSPQPNTSGTFTTVGGAHIGL